MKNDGNDELDIIDVYEPQQMPTAILVRNTQELDPRHAIVKTKGGFLLGCSAEAMLALGTVCAHAFLHGHRNLDAVFDGKLFAMKVFFTQADDGVEHLRTVYAEYLRDIQNKEVVKVKEESKSHERVKMPELRVTITGILPNPIGQDAGNEKIRLKKRGNAHINLEDTKCLKIVINEQEPLILSNVNKANFNFKGAEVTITLPDDAPLPNNGAVVRIFDKNGAMLDSERYASAKKQGQWFLYGK